MTTAQLSTSLKGITRSGLETLWHIPARIWLTAWSLHNAAAKQRSRRHLAELDDRLLKDIGISRKQAEHEAQKSFWN